MSAAPEQHADSLSPQSEPPQGEPSRGEPPRGVPRWLWPPPGAQVVQVLIVEIAPQAGQALAHRVEGGEAPAKGHLRALRWLLDEHPRASPPTAAGPAERHVRLEIAATPMPAGRIGHAYALDGGPLGAPAGDMARGLLWRYIQARVGV